MLSSVSPYLLTGSGPLGRIFATNTTASPPLVRSIVLQTDGATVTSFALSSDGTRFAVGDNDGVCMVYTVEGGGSRFVTGAHDGDDDDDDDDFGLMSQEEDDCGAAGNKSLPSFW